MRAFVTILVGLILFSGQAQTSDDFFKEAASSYVLGDFEATKTVLTTGLSKLPKDKKLLALAEKVGGIDLKKPESAKKEVVKVKEKPQPVQSEPSKSDITRSVLKDHLVFSNGEKLNLEKGEKLVCMFSLSCGHCQHAYRDLCSISKDGNLPKMYLYNYGQEFDEKYFFNQAGGCVDASIRFEDYSTFTRLLQGEGFPRILAFKNGQIVKEWDIVSFNEKSVRDFYNIPKKEAPKPKEEGVKIESGSQWGGSGEKKPWE